MPVDTDILALPTREELEVIMAKLRKEATAKWYKRNFTRKKLCPLSRAAICNPRNCGMAVEVKMLGGTMRCRYINCHGDLGSETKTWYYTVRQCAIVVLAGKK
jgi:hypothetical protein